MGEEHTDYHLDYDMKADGSVTIHTPEYVEGYRIEAESPESGLAKLMHAVNRDDLLYNQIVVAKDRMAELQTCYNTIHRLDSQLGEARTDLGDLNDKYDEVKYELEESRDANSVYSDQIRQCRDAVTTYLVRLEDAITHIEKLQSVWWRFLFIPGLSKVLDDLRQTRDDIESLEEDYLYDG